MMLTIEIPQIGMSIYRQLVMISTWTTLTPYDINRVIAFQNDIISVAKNEIWNLTQMIWK